MWLKDDLVDWWQKVLQSVSSVKYCVVIVDAKLSWNKHVSYISSKATQTLNLLHSNMYFCDAPAKNKAFRAHVLPVLDYASTVWNSHTHKNIFTLQKIQSYGARWMWGSRFNCHNHTWSKSSIVNEVVNSIYISFYMVQVSHNSYHLWYISLSYLFALSTTFSYSPTRSLFAV